MNEFKSMLKYLRVRAGLTQSELADRLDISASSVAMYETGKREPNFELLESIADYFNVDMNFLLGKEEPREKEEYYINAEARELAQFLYENPEYKILFDASRKVKPEDIEFVKQMIDKMS